MMILIVPRKMFMLYESPYRSMIFSSDINKGHSFFTRQYVQSSLVGWRFHPFDKPIRFLTALFLIPLLPISLERTLNGFVQPSFIVSKLSNKIIVIFLIYTLLLKFDERQVNKLALARTSFQKTISLHILCDLQRLNAR